MDFPLPPSPRLFLASYCPSLPLSPPHFLTPLLSILLPRRELTEKPHIAGNVSDVAVAMLVYNRWKGYKFDKLELTNYTVLLQYPGNYTRPNQLQLQNSTGGVIYNASIQQEKPLTPGENDSSVAPPFNAYSGNGNATVSEWNESG